MPSFPADTSAVALTRRAMVGGSAATMVISLAPPGAAATPTARQPGPVVETASGKLRGATRVGVHVFKGIRYGEDTAPRRFRRALPARKWTGVRDALAYGAQSPQLLFPIAGMALLADFHLPQPESEDCLFLNVWTPATSGRRPVMVWLHGGGFVAGSGASPVYDGTRLCNRGDVVVVTLNHRLGAFGYLHLGDLAGERYRDSGNVGNLDIVMALEWVRDNIAAFGGDPGNVTIFGESGGGYKVSALMAMPAAKSLFHKAAVQSGALLLAHTRDEMTAYAARLLARLGVAAQGAGELEAMAAPDITAMLQHSVADLGWKFGPVIDGHNLPGHPSDAGALALSANVPLLIGANKDEAALTATAATLALPRAELPARLAAILPGRDGERLATGLEAIYPFAAPGELFVTAGSWAMMRKNTLVQAERKADAEGAPAFSYLLSWETPVDGGKWKSPHALDLPLVFDNVAISSSMVGTGEQVQRVADAMANAWLRFARTGSPGWPAYDRSQRLTMVFDATSRVVGDPYAEERKLMAGPPIPSPAS